jgi:hypothetical protein
MRGSDAPPLEPPKAAQSQIGKKRGLSLRLGSPHPSIVLPSTPPCLDPRNRLFGQFIGIDHRQQRRQVRVQHVDASPRSSGRSPSATSGPSGTRAQLDTHKQPRDAAQAAHGLCRIPDNDHVFRHRAPLDPERLCVRPNLVPEPARGWEISTSARRKPFDPERNQMDASLAAPR